MSNGIDTRVILIGGTSHAGKSTLPHALASNLDWGLISTDRLAAHPGRPWKKGTRPLSKEVADYYLSLSVEDLVTDVLRHYKGMWPGIEALVRRHATSLTADRLVLEGSALWPERVPALCDLNNVAMFWLTADDDLIESRILAQSRYEAGTTTEKAPVEKFVARSIRYNELMMSAVNKLGLVRIDVGKASSTDELMNQCIELVSTARPSTANGR